MNVDEELTLRCRNAWARGLETELRRTIYQWKHMPGDMVVNPWIDCPLAIHSTDFGIVEEVDIARTDSANEIVSRHFHIQIKEPEDIEKIKMPQVTHVEKTTAVVWDAMRDLFEGIIPVRKIGQTHIWFTPWDYLIRWWGIEEAMLDMIDRPEMVHAAYERMVDAWMIELDQFEEQNLLSLDCANVRIGSGGYGYVSELPGESCDPAWVRPRNMWGCRTLRYWPQSLPRCTGSSPWSTTFDGCGAGASTTTAAARRSTAKWVSSSASPICVRYR